MGGQQHAQACRVRRPQHPNRGAEARGSARSRDLEELAAFGGPHRIQRYGRRGMEVEGAEQYCVGNT